MSQGSPLGVCVLPERGINLARTVTYPNYVFEVLEHAGVFHQPLELNELAGGALDRIRILVTVGDGELPPWVGAKLKAWLAEGGAWLSVAGTCGMDELLGATRVEPQTWAWAGGVRSLGEGYLVPMELKHPALKGVRRPVHLFGGATVAAKGANVLARVDDKHGRATDRPGLLEHSFGRGRTMLLAVNLTGTIVRIQQGVGVTRDGVPSSDGSASCDDLILKADDGAVLDWDFDREAVAGAPNFQAFVEPVADVWKEIFLRCIFHLAREQGVALAVLWLYPRGLPALAHMSHDTDFNEPEKAEQLLGLLEEAGIKTTWCVIVPGYERVLIEKIKSAGHELAMHYDGISEGKPWSKEEFAKQCRELKEIFGQQPVTNKNHLARWEGDCEFWEWCVREGIQLDQSKAASKTGESGFNFGTCHPYFPVLYNGTEIDCLELCTPIWDLHVFAPPEVFEALLESVKRHHGILHQLFHPYHTPKLEVGKALLAVARRAREEGMEWWTARQINRWERARRRVRVESCDAREVVLRGGDETLEDATVLFLQPDGGDFEAWGFGFASAVRTIRSGQLVSFVNGTSA